MERPEITPEDAPFLRQAERYCRHRAAMAWTDEERECWHRQAAWNADLAKRAEEN
jgi:hypothetical protein